MGPDGTDVDQGVPLATPKTIRGEILAIYRSRIRRGLSKDYEGFAADLLVEIDETDVERFNVHASPRFANGLSVTAVKVSFQL
jgi:phage tail sheath gpL-like